MTDGQNDDESVSSDAIGAEGSNLDPDDDAVVDIEDRIDLIRDSILDRVLIESTTLIFGLLVVLVSLIVIIRQIPGFQLSQLNALSRYAFIITVFLGAAIAGYNRRHVQINYFIDKLGEHYPVTRHVIDLINKILVIIFISIVIIGAYINVIENFGLNPGDTRVVTMAQIYFGILVGFVCMLLYELLNLRQTARSLFNHLGDE